MRDVIERHLRTVSLKKTKTTDGVYFEQKITPDVLSFTCQCVVQHLGNDWTRRFTDDDIRRLPFFTETITSYFTKPGQSPLTENEYNKFTSYHLGLLGFAGLLAVDYDATPRTYRAIQQEIIAFIAASDRNATLFLQLYIEKLLHDNGLTQAFAAYDETQSGYERLKAQFLLWAREHTNVRTTDPKHTYRVFNKIFNLYAYTHGKAGEYRARVVPGRCRYDYLVYGRENFRDAGRPRGISRQEYEQTLQREEGSGYIGYLTGIAKQQVKLRHRTTEIVDQRYTPERDGAIQVHHLFAQSAYAEFSSYHENLICLTSGQHYSHAHDGRTSYIAPRFQLVCLLRKLDAIETSLRAHDGFYSLERFIEMLNTGFSLHLSDSTSVVDIRSLLEQRLRSLPEEEHRV